MVTKTILSTGLFLACAVAAHAESPSVMIHPHKSPLTSPSVLAKEEELAKVPGAVSLVRAEKFEGRYAKDFKDTLASVPGVFAQNRFGEEVRLSIRGSGISRGFHLRGVELLVDGVPINLADGSGDFQEIDPMNAQYMEVYKGANALRYGASTLGGAVNVVTPTARNVDYNYLFRLEGGSFGNIRSHVATAQTGDKFDAYAAMTAAHADGYRQQSREDKARINTNVGYRISDKAETRFYVTYNNLNQEVPGSLTKADALNNPTSSPLTNRVNDNARDIRSVRFANTTAVQISSATKLEAGAFVNDKQLFHPIFQVIDQKSLDYGVFSRVDHDFDFFGLGHHIMGGVNYHGGDNDAKQFNNVGGSRGTQTADAKHESHNIALYGEGQFHVVPDVSAILGGQVMWAQRDFTNHLNAAANDGDTFVEYNPKLGVLWDVNPASQVFANVSRSSEVATFSELVQQPVVGFVPLEPQTAWTAEIGTRGSQGNWAWDLSAYHARVKNEMLQFTTNPLIPAATFNADETIHQGLELGSTWRFAHDLWRGNDAWTWSQIYNLNDFYFKDDAQFGDNQIAGVPRHLLRTEIKYKQENWSIAPVVEWAPEAPYVDFANTTKATDYVILNLEAQAKITDNVDFFVEGRNLTDENYISNVNTVVNASVGAAPAVFYPGDGRSFFTGIKAKF